MSRLSINRFLLKKRLNVIIDFGPKSILVSNIPNFMIDIHVTNSDFPLFFLQSELGCLFGSPVPFSSVGPINSIVPSTFCMCFIVYNPLSGGRNRGA